MNSFLKTCPLFLSQTVLLDFASGGFGQFRKFDCSGTFKTSQVLVAKVNDLLLCNAGVGLESNEGFGNFTPFFVRDGNDSHL
jgi:hypothetical protein